MLIPPELINEVAQAADADTFETMIKDKYILDIVYYSDAYKRYRKRKCKLYSDLILDEFREITRKRKEKEQQYNIYDRDDNIVGRLAIDDMGRMVVSSDYDGFIDFANTYINVRGTFSS